MDYSPVCGRDGITYANRCVAERGHNVAVVSDGSCQAVAQTGASSASGSTGSTLTGGISHDENEKTLTGAPQANLPVSTGSADTLTGLLESIVNDATGTLNPPSDSGSAAGTGLQMYVNANFNYRFSLPKNVYYQAFGAQDGANHTVAVNVGTGVTDFASAGVKVYFYSKVLPQLSGKTAGTAVTDTANGQVFVRGTNSSLMVESDNLNSITVETILQTVQLP